MKKTLLIGLACGMTALTSSAFAQQPAPAATEPAPADTGAAPAATTPPAATPPPPAAPAADGKKKDGPDDPGGRVRWGLSTGFGWHVPASMFLINGEGRIGYQISNMLSVYGAVGGTAGLGFSAEAGFQGVSVSASALAIGYVGAIAEAMFGNLFYVGGGPVFVRGSYVGTSVGASSAGVAEVSSVTSAGNKFGLDIRFGFGFGKPKGDSKRRGGFNLGIDALILFHPSALTVTTRADGPNGTAGASVSETGLSVGLAPMLTLGYDSR